MVCIIRLKLNAQFKVSPLWVKTIDIHCNHSVNNMDNFSVNELQLEAISLVRMIKVWLGELNKKITI